MEGASILCPTATRLCLNIVVCCIYAQHKAVFKALSDNIHVSGYRGVSLPRQPLAQSSCPFTQLFLVRYVPHTNIRR